MPNPNPTQSEGFIASRVQPLGTRALSRGQVTFRLYPEHYAIICSHKSKGIFTRNLLTAMFEGRYQEAIKMVEDLKDAHKESLET